MNSESDPSPSPRAPAPSPVDSIRDLGAFFVHYLELRLQLLGLESRETAFHLLVLALLLVATLVLFWRLCHNVGGFPALPDDADVALGMGLERLGPWSYASRSQYWSGGNLQIQDRMAIFPGHLRRVSKGS